MLTIIDNGQPQRVVSGRVEEIVRILLNNQDEITKPDKLLLRFDCAGQTVVPRIERTLERSAH